MTDPTSHLTAALADRYRIERELGQGGMATVYLAHDLKHDRKVALKVLRPELAAVIGAERFLAEIKTTANLQHPHILPLFDSGRTGQDERWREDFVYYVMPFVEGESLRDRLSREHQLPVDEAVRIAREVADALDYAHRHGVVHRDIKPENILLHDGRAQVADFGIALAVSRSDGGTRMTETGMSLGTPHYMAPEQAMGEREITPKADVYALGCVLYEMLVGEPPFAGPTAQAIIARVMTEEPRSLTIQRRTIPPHVEAAVVMALAKLPADRFATAAAFSEALGKTDFTVAATRVAPAAAPPAVRRGLVVRVLPWVLVAAAIAVAVVGWLRRTPPVVTRQRIVLWTHPVPPGFLHTGLAISPDGATTVFVDTIGGTQQLWAKERDEIDPKPLTGTTGAVGPAFSPDGEWIAFVADGKLKKVPRLGGSAIAIADSATTDYPDIAWLDDGTITFANPSNALLATSQDGGNVRTLVNTDTLQWGVVSASPLPKGRGVLIGMCTPGCLQMSLYALDLRSGEQHALSDGVVKGWYTPAGNVVFVRQDGGVFIAPFDLDALTFRQAAVPVFQGVRTGFALADMALSPSGTLIYATGAAFASGTAARAVWVNRDGTATPVDSGWPPFVPATYPSLSLSPDGRRLAVNIQSGGTADIWIKQLDRGPLTRLTFAGNNNVPEWTADGRTVMYVAGLGSTGGGGDVHARRADGTGAEETLVDVQRQIVEVARTPDTAQLIVRLTLPPSRDIMLWHRGDTTLTPLLAEPYQEIEPALSPDGRWLAYNSDESGRTEIYVRPFPNVTGGRWQVSRNGGSEPLWSHSGRELFFRNAQGELVSVSVTPGPSFDAGEQRVLFNASNFLPSQGHRLYDITPDDRRFVFLRSVDEAQSVAGPVNLVEVDNWFAELGAKQRN